MSAKGRQARRAGRPAALVLAALTLVLTLLQAVASADPGARRAGTRPNIVVIMTDDQTLESMRVMKRVDRLLARQGTTFLNNFATFPLCCPSRATFLTGQYSHNHGVVGNSLQNGINKLDESNTLPVWLQGAGYSTTMVGKYLNGYGQRSRTEIPPGWTEWYAGVKLAYLNHSMNRNGRFVPYGARPADYQTDVYAATAVDVIRRRAPERQPFFLWLSFFAPHEGGPVEPDDPAELRTPAPAARHQDKFAAMPVPASASFDEEDVSDKPIGIRNRRRLTPEDRDAIRENYQQRLESLLAVDEAVGAVVSALRKSGELDRTVIVFTSDNGFLEGEHRVRAGKVLPYEPSIRVPLIMRGPNVPVDARLAQPVGNIDLAPTIAKIAGATAGRVEDGRSLLPLLVDPELEWGRDLLIERGPESSGAGDRLSTGIRTPRFMYTEYVNGERELYDLAVDAGQLQSLHADPAYDGIKAELARRLTELRECVGAVCRRGPALRLSLVKEAGCDRAARITGVDGRLVSYVDFELDGRRVGRDTAAPFERALTGASARRQARLRVLTVLADGRRITLERLASPCGET